LPGPAGWRSQASTVNDVSALDRYKDAA